MGKGQPRLPFFVGVPSVFGLSDSAGEIEGLTSASFALHFFANDYKKERARGGQTDAAQQDEYPLFQTVD